MELFTTILRYASVNKSIETDTPFVGENTVLQAPLVRPPLPRATDKNTQSKFMLTRAL